MLSANSILSVVLVPIFPVVLRVTDVPVVASSAMSLFPLVAVMPLVPALMKIVPLPALRAVPVASSDKITPVVSPVACKISMSGSPSGSMVVIVISFF